MIISPPFLPAAGLSSTDPTETDPMMAAVDGFELAHGIYPVAFDRRWHCGAHLAPDMHSPVYTIADGEVVAWRVCQHAYESGGGTPDSNAGFVLLKHTTETGEGRSLTFYSLYMHLLELAQYQSYGANANLLPAFLRTPSAIANPSVIPPAQSGGNHKVYRKDVLGWIGQCHGQKHLHFEIFMTKPDFDAYFGRTQLGRETATQPSDNDCWGRSYHVIPAGQSFRSLPPGTDAQNKLHGILFEPGQSGQNTQPLHVEAYFHKGTKYTKVWSVADDGTRILLTATPVAEKDYEYDLYKRAAALYPTCPSDGYELLRFGRILSTPATLPENARVTWVRVTYAAGQYGYIDISNASNLKLSDANFGMLGGWQKISDGNTPFNQNGLCDIDRLKKILKDAKDHQTSKERALNEEYQKEDALARYVRTGDGVRAQLRGFVCEAPSEWDSTSNEMRYQKLKDPGEFYEGNEAGYTKFMAFVKSFQFWNNTGLPAGEKLWFFHPLQFIRCFRRCNWLSLREQIQLLPRNSMADAGGNISWVRSKARFTSGANDEGGTAPQSLGVAINHAFQKYGFDSGLRKAHFFGQIFKETAALKSTVENGDSLYFTKMYEQYTTVDAAYDFDHKHTWLDKLGFLKNRDRPAYIAQRPGEVHDKAVAGENVQLGDGPRFCGRGLIHLTWRKGYREYGQYRAKNFTTDPNPILLQSDSEVAADSAGYFWDKTRINRKADRGSSNEDVTACFKLVGGAGGLPARQQFFRYAYFILGDSPRMPPEPGLVRQTEGN